MFDEAIQMDSSYIPVYKYKALVLAQNGMFQEMIECIDQVIKSQPANPVNYSYKAAALRGLKKFEEALGAVDITVKLLSSDDPRIIDVYFKRAELLEELGRFDESIEIYDLCTMNESYFGYANVFKAFLLLKQGKNEEALALIDLLIEKGVGQSNNKVLHAKALAFKQLGKLEEALKLYDEFCELAPSDSQADDERNELKELMAQKEYALKSNANAD